MSLFCQEIIFKMSIFHLSLLLFEIRTRTQFILTVFMSLFTLSWNMNWMWQLCKNVFWTLHRNSLVFHEWHPLTKQTHASDIYQKKKKKRSLKADSIVLNTDRHKVILPFHLTFWHLTQECYLVSFIGIFKMLFETLAFNATLWSHLVVAHLLSPASQFKWVENKGTIPDVNKVIACHLKKPFTLILEHNYFFSTPSNLEENNVTLRYPKAIFCLIKQPLHKQEQEPSCLCCVAKMH